MSRAVILSRLSKGPHAGQKAPADVRAIAKGLGATAIDLSPYVSKPGWKRLTSSLAAACRILASIQTVRRADALILQHPLGRLNDVILGVLARDVPSVTFIHDVEMLRWPRHSLWEARRLAKSDVLVAHTGAMAEYLTARIPNVVVVDLERFDYLVANPPSLARTASAPNRLLIAGSLNSRKAPYVYQITDLALPVDLYGPACQVDRLQRGTSYRGVLRADRPVLDERDGFGLVWDGTSTTSLTGPTGVYLRYNAPHKFSLYMALGIPVVVARGSALAALVTDQGLGLVVDDIPSAAVVVSRVTPERWADLLRNVERFRTNLVQGVRTKAVLVDALRTLGVELDGPFALDRKAEDVAEGSSDSARRPQPDASR